MTGKEKQTGGAEQDRQTGRDKGTNWGCETVEEREGQTDGEKEPGRGSETDRLTHRERGERASWIDSGETDRQGNGKVKTWKGRGWRVRQTDRWTVGETQVSVE